MATDTRDTLEMRLALVCYGGVSLAIYMSGITREIQEVVTGSAIRPPAGAGEPPGTAAVYGRLLAALEKAADDRGDPHRIQVGVDVVAGTSAGGINGICLARALDGDYSQEAIRDFWITEGDFKKLLDPKVKQLLTAVSAQSRGLAGIAEPLDKALGTPPPSTSFLGRSRLIRWARRIGAAVHLRKPVTEFVTHRPPSVLSGDLMCRLTWKALTQMRRPDRPRPDGLVFADTGIDLAVTATEFAGHYDAVPLSRQVVFDEAHRHVFRLRGDGQGVLDPDVGMLAFAARATASFPGAFAPVSLEHFRTQLHGDGEGEAWDAVAARYFERYPGDDQAGARRFVDGGVLDNMPFDAAIAAVRSRTAASEVRRALVYVEPSPTVVNHPDALRLRDLDVPPPGNLAAETFRSISTIPLSQTMGDQVAKVRRRNTDADELRSVIEQRFDDVRERVAKIAAGTGRPDALEHPAGAVDAGWWRAVGSEVHASDDLTPTYTRVKVSQVVNGLAELAADACGYPADSAQRELVRAAMRRSAVRAGFLPRVGAQAGPSRVQDPAPFLRAFDVDYERRRIAFVRDGLAWAYGLSDGPSRTDVSAVKAVVAERAAAVERAARAAAADRGFAEAAAHAFSTDALRRLVPPPDARPEWDADTELEEFARRHEADVAGVHAAAKAALAPLMSGFGRETFEQLHTALAGWVGDRAALRRDLLIRYAGFPIWDAITFPITLQRGVTERDGNIEVRRISPLETHGIEPPSGTRKLYGVGVHHFGAFFEEGYRQNDYLWGRLDGCCQLVDLLVNRILPVDEAKAFNAAPFVHDACREALRQEWQRLDKVRDLAEAVWGQVTDEPPPGTAPAAANGGR
ncbi:MAG TPA: patatin-like protein [Gaiellales bacterium]|nr:patatin-like protein [Gaiellales bacterium]